MKFRALRYTLLLIALFSITLLLRASLPSVATGTWVAAGNLSAARSGACTVVLSDGRLLISGGADANGPTTTADLFSTTGSWSAAASMNAARSHQSCAVLQDGRVVVAGGTTSGGGITNSAEIYDPSADSWSQAGIMNDARSGATASVLQDGRVLIAGGQNSGGALNTLEIFDPNSGNFSNAGTMSSPRQDHAAAVLSDGRVLIVGGSSDGANALNTTDIYNPQAAGSVSAGPAMSTPRVRHTATTLLDGTVVVIGGSDYTNDVASAEFFDPVANNFNAASSLATARSKHSAFLLPNNNEVLVVGGQSAGADVASAELYIPWQKAFQATGAMANPRSDATGAALTNVNGRLLMAGGSTASAELYGFATVKTDAADYPPGTTVNITGTGWQPGETVTLTLVESPLIDTHGPYPVVADAFGNISDSSFTTDSHDENIRFYLTAAGSQSQAQNTFTDAVSVNTSVTSNSNPSVVGQSVQFTATATQNGNNGAITCGSIQFKDGATNIGSAVALNGVSDQVSISTSTLTQGSHSVTAVYSDPGNACGGNNNKTNTALTQLVAGAATKLAFVQQPSNTIASLSISPAVTVEVEDVNGTRVSNSTASITMAIGANPGSGTLAGLTAVNAVNGTATFSNLSINKTGTAYTLSATSTGLSSATSTTFNITPGAATQLAFSQQPTNTAAGASITPAVTVQVLDASNNLITTGTGSTASITIAIGTNPSSGTLSGTATVTAVAGVATFSNLSIDKIGSGYTLTAASTGLTGMTSSAFNIIPGAASKLVFIQQPTNATAAQTITPAVTVQVQDASGNPVTTSTASITVAIGTNPGSSTLSGTVTQSAVGGVATFGNLSINKAGTGYTLTGGSTGLTGATSSTFNITAGAATQLVFSQQPSNTQAGSSISPAVSVQVQDGTGNVVTTSTVSITVAIGTNPNTGTLSGTKTVSASAGVATFSNLSIDKAGNGYTLSAGSIGLTGVTSSPFNVSAGAATKLVVTGSATQTAGTGNTLTITAEDSFGNTDTTFGNGSGGNVSLTFSGANASPDPATQPTATSKNGAAVTFGTGTALMFVNGMSSSVMTLYKAETANISVADGQGVTPGSLTVVVSAAAASKLALSGSTANLSSGSTRALTATVQDAFGNTIATDTRSVTFTQTAGTGSVTGLGSSNAVAGVASLTVTGNLAGTVTITASASGLASGTGNPITFSVVAGAAAKLALSGATTDLASGNTRTLTATIQDAVGNTVNTGTDSTISITFARTLGTGTVTGLGSSNAVAGVATITVTGALAGSITIAASGTASTGALAASTGNPITFNVVAGPAAKVALSGSTADLASGTTRQLTATIQDAGGNTVSTGADSTIAISFAKTGGTGTVTGLGSSSAVAGVATLTVTGNLAGPVTITASGTASTGALAIGAGNPIAFNVVAGAAAKLEFALQPANTTAGQTISAVTVQILDANGNLTSSTASVAMALTGSPAGVTLSGTLTKAAVSGVATFNDLSINKGGTYTLSATSSGLTGATSASFTINNPAPTLTSIAPASGNLTQTLNVVFTGTNFISGVSSVNFGSDITVNTTSVDSATQITANIAIASTAATGPRNVSVTNSAPGGGTSATQSFTVVNPATTTQVVSSLNPSTFGLSVTFTATVSSAAGTPAGTLIFYDGACGVSALTGSLNLASSQATFTTASLNGGTHTISACYTPSGIFQSSFGTVSQVVTQATPTVTFTGAPATAYFNSQFTVSATTNASTTPTITASGACTILGTTVTITSGVGTCSLSAGWAADANYVAATATQSTSALQVPVSVTVSNTTVTYDGTPKAVTPTVVPAVVYSVTYTGISPTVYATSSTAPTEPGSYLVVATVTDPNYAGSGSGTLTISQKDPALVLALLTGMPEPSSYGTLVYFELMTANSPCPTGQVQFFVDSDSTPSATVALTSTTCANPVEFSTATLTPGTHSVYAVYGGDTYYVNETSASVSHQVIADGTTVTLATSATEVFVGDSVTLTATVTLANSIDGNAAPPSGTVQFFDNKTTPLGESPLSSNSSAFTATLSISSLPAGPHSITATYVSANGDFVGSSSAVSMETVDKITPNITWPNPADIVYGTKLSATQLNATATDAHNGGIPVSGTFTYNPAVDTVLVVGSRNLTVSFAPDDTATYGTQTASATINVTPATLTVTADNASRYYGADNPTFTFQYGGFVNSEDKTIVTTAPTCSSTADSKSNIGTYAITCSGGVATNYTIKYVDGKLTVNPATLTASIVGNPSKPYDGNTTATLTSGNFSLSGVAAGDSIMITKTAGTYNAADVASANTVTVALASTDFTAGTGTLLTNYTLPTSASGAGQITKANANIMVTPYSVTYDGNPHTATGTAKGVQGLALAGLDLSGTSHTNAGTYASDPWTFTDVTGNYNNASGTVSDVIKKANAVIAVTPYSVTYDGNAHTATGSATGVKGEVLSGLDLSGTTHINAGTYASDPWTFTDTTGNYCNTSGTVSDLIKKANAVIAVTPYSVTYDGNSHMATGSATGVKGEVLSGLDLSGTTHINAGTYASDPWTFTDATGNYNNASGTVSDLIKKANAVITVTPYSVTYDGNAHMATGSATGVKGESLSGLDLSGTAHTNAGTYGSDPWTFTDATGNYCNTSGTVSDLIKKANAVIAVTPYSVTYDGNAHTATGSATGVKGESLSGLDLSGTTHINAGTYASDPWTFTDATGNYCNTSGTVSDLIKKANAVITVTPYSVTYDGTAHMATGSATGVKGESLSGLDLSGTTHTAAGTYGSDPWTFTDATGNYCNTSGTVSDLIKKANAIITVTPYSVTYDGASHSATGMAKGVLGETLLGLDLSGTAHTTAGTYTDTWTFTDATGNYCNTSGTVSDSISQVAAKIVVNGYSGAYDGGAHGATGTAFGVESPTPADLSSLLHLGASFTNVPGGTANWTFDGNTNYKPASGTATITITARPITVSADAEGKVFGQIDPIPLTYKVTSGSLASGDSFSGILTRMPGEDVGAYSILQGTLALSDISNYNLNFVGSSLTISPALTTTSVVSSLPSSNYGQSVTFTATVTPQYSGTPTGSVAFYNLAGTETCSTLLNSSLIGGALLSGGQASVSTSTLPPSSPGTLPILACYAPDNPPGDYFASSGTFAQTVIPAPVVSLNATSLSFGNQQAGTTSTQGRVTVTNIGTAALSITGSAIAGTNASYFAFATPSTGTDCRTVGSVAINASCNIAVVFKPVDTGSATAIVNITDNDKNQSGSVQQVLLTGASVSSINSVASLFSYGIFATANGCGALTVSGGSSVDSFDSTIAGGYSASHQNSGGNVGANGNLNLSGSNVAINGSASLPMITTGNCSSKSLTGFSTSGGAQVAGGLVQLSKPVVYAAPAMPSPAPPTTNQSLSGSCGTISSGCTNNGSKNVSLAPGTYGNLTASGGTTMHVSTGTYNLNSLTLSGNSILVVDSGPVVMNIAGNSLSGGGTALDLSGGSMSNVSGMPSNLQFYYGGSRSTKLSGGAGDFAVVYAPNSPITLSGGSHFYGAIVGNTITLSGGTMVHYDRSLPNIVGGSYIWFNSAAMNVQNLPSSANAKVFVTNASISFTANGTPYSLAVPNAVITFSPTATSASASWDSANQRWSTLVPRSMVTGNTSIHTFLDGLAFPVPANFPGGIQNATWSAAFATDTPGVTFQWQWAAAVYTSFNTAYSDGTTNNLLGVNPIDSTDPAGTPESYKSFLTTGGSGAGATNWTGFNVGTAGVVPTMAPASVSPSSLNFGTVGVNTTSGSMTAVLSNNQSGPLTINANGITISGTNAGDFTETDNCLAPTNPTNTLAGGGGSCTITITFAPKAAGVRKAKISVNDNANNTPQTVFVTGTGQ